MSITVEPCGPCAGEGSKVTPADLCALRPTAAETRCSRCWGRGVVPAGFLPADVVVHCMPLTDAFERSECEFAAGMIVLTLVARGNTWRRIALAELRALAEEETAANRDPMTASACNPFIRPDFAALIGRGYADRDETGAIGFTTEGIAALAMWVALPKVAD